MPQISRETIQRIIDENDIVDVIGGYLSLKRAGTNFRALCPFHNEKTPSFNVNPHRQIFHCFGCQAGGDVIRFVMQYENLPFPDAAKKLAERAGIRIEEEVFDAKEEALRKMRKELLALNRKAAEWFHWLLFKRPVAQVARDYLRSRALGMDTARSWLFGYAPESGQQLIEWAASQGYTVRHLVESGLAAWRDEVNPGRGAYARFRHRLMFPIANDFGDIIGFSGRVLSPDQKGGKYVNSPETSLFNKSKTLFGLDRSKRAIHREDRAIVCEGQLDMIMAYEAGIENIVAPLGTALTEQHARLLRRNTEEIVLCYDSDAAGYNATLKAFQVLAGAGLLVRVASLPEGDDPDSFIRKHGPEAFKALTSAAPEFFNFLISHRSGDLSGATLRDRLQFAREVAAFLALVEDKMLQDALINRLITQLGVGETELRKLVSDARREADRAARTTARRDAAEQKRESAAANAGPVPPGGSRPAGAVPAAAPGTITLQSRSVRILCQVLLSDARTRGRLTATPAPEFFHDLAETEILTRIWEADFDPDQPGSVAAFTSALDPAEQNCIAQLLSSSLPENAADEADSCLRELKRKALQRRRQAILSRMKSPSLEPGELEALTKQLLDLTNRLNDIPPPAIGGETGCATTS